MSDWVVVQSTSENKPKDIDTESSQYYVYERRNIRKEKIKDSFLSNSDSQASNAEQWVFEERAYTKEEWNDLHSPLAKSIMQAISDIEFSVTSLQMKGSK